MPAHPLFLPLFLTLLIFLPPSHGCRYGTEDECRKASFVPGHNLVGEGFNIVTMETTGTTVVDMMHQAEARQGDKCNNCTLCYNSLLRKEQKLPAAVADWRIKVRCRRSVSSRTFESSNSVLKESSQSTSTSWMIGLGMEEMGFGFALGGSHSKSSSFAQEHSQKDTYSYSSIDFKCDYYTFRLNAVPPLSEEFVESLKKLPINASTNHEMYRHFLDIYGTHYIRRVHLGGHVKTTTAIRTCETAMKGVKASSVSNCLSVEAYATVSEVTGSAALEHCKEQGKKFGTSQGFSAAFHDRITEVLGGDGDVHNILLSGGKESSYKHWLNSLKWVPGVVSYKLSPLHMLVRNNPTLRSKLREAIRGYIKRKAVPLKCTRKCKQGKPNKNCACKCSANGEVDASCCPERPGGATITVTVHKATGTWGDHFTGTDGFVVIRYGGKSHWSWPVVYNNNSPTFNFRRVFRKANLPSRKPVKVEIWDEDHGWDDDRLGWANIVPKKGTFRNKRYRLNHGSMYVSMSVECLPRLTGPLCNQYLHEPETSRKTEWGLSMVLDTSALPEGTLTSHNNKFV